MKEIASNEFTSKIEEKKAAFSNKLAILQLEKVNYYTERYKHNIF